MNEEKLFEYMVVYLGFLVIIVMVNFPLMLFYIITKNGLYLLFYFLSIPAIISAIMIIKLVLEDKQGGSR